ncbi:glycosyltransferase family 25 protein [Succinatimonas hippei]|uniref:glycosyltransferase family 25 protein n=1 Tax=Succinatimonas hippei TaxID=626938 RepID=UPI0026F2C445|nr:glycosyltransferase family 25 protein [Succinatimonas hippei]
MIPIFVINLPSNKLRKDAVLKNFSDVFGKTVIPAFFEGTNGHLILNDRKCLDDKIVSNNQNTELFLRFGKKVTIQDPLTPGEIGCALSHLNLYKYIIENHIQHALIMEDDTLFKPLFPLVLEQTLKQNINWDIIQFIHSNGLRDFNLNRKIIIDKKNNIYLKKAGLGIFDSLFNRRRLSFSAACYLISLKACKRLIEIGFPVRLPADYLTGHVAFNQLKLYTCNPQTAFTYTKSFCSDIGERPKHKLY